MHFIADAMRSIADEVRFFSLGFSNLSKLRHDHRSDLDARSNRWERVNGIECYLWKNYVHPFSAGLGVLEPLMGPLYDLWARLPCDALDSAARRADLVIFESGVAPILIARVSARAPNAKITYLASDLLETIGVHPRIGRALRDATSLVDDAIVVARSMRQQFARFEPNVFFVPHGLDESVFDRDTGSPYKGGRNVVTVGSMLFDPAVFQVAAEHFPDVTFHLIGTPPGHSFPANTLEYGTMPFEDTIPYLRHANAGVAPYKGGTDAGYLVDSSMKLMQFGYLGLPSICPNFAAGDKPLRFGYDAHEPLSIVGAFRNALDPAVERVSVPALTWDEVAQRIMDPRGFIDTLR